ncbi:hypothetical protein Daus18300_003033 [Diaporthe australafricana]|uniref:Uncharacterized protein n=1 Tax=Diaporthe australafricana TaxID=127596 RepID=A0ABR3XJZ8_9PEZI
MSDHHTLPPELRLEVYEFYIADYLDAPGICKFPSEIPDRRLIWRHRNLQVWHKILSAEVKLAVPSPLRAEQGEIRSHLLKWLAKEKGISQDANATTLRFPDRVYRPERDFLYLNNPDQVNTLIDLLDLSWGISIRTFHMFRRSIRRIALVDSIRRRARFPQFLKSLDLLPRLQELAFVFVELAPGDHGNLEFVAPWPKTNHATYSVEPLADGDIAPSRWKLRKKIERLETTVRPMLGNHAQELKITACKVVPRE